MTIDPITLAEALALTIPAAVRDAIPRSLAPTPHMWAGWARDLVTRYQALQAGPTVGSPSVRAAAEDLAADLSAGA